MPTFYRQDNSTQPLSNEFSGDRGTQGSSPGFKFNRMTYATAAAAIYETYVKTFDINETITIMGADLHGMTLF